MEVREHTNLERNILFRLFRRFTVARRSPRARRVPSLILPPPHPRDRKSRTRFASKSGTKVLDMSPSTACVSRSRTSPSAYPRSHLRTSDEAPVNRRTVAVRTVAASAPRAPPPPAPAPPERWRASRSVASRESRLRIARIHSRDGFRRRGDKGASASESSESESEVGGVGGARREVGTGAFRTRAVRFVLVALGAHRVEPLEHVARRANRRDERRVVSPRARAGVERVRRLGQRPDVVLVASGFSARRVTLRSVALDQAAQALARPAGQRVFPGKRCEVAHGNQQGFATAVDVALDVSVSNACAAYTNASRCVPRHGGAFFVVSASSPASPARPSASPLTPSPMSETPLAIAPVTADSNEASAAAAAVGAGSGSSRLGSRKSSSSGCAAGSRAVAASACANVAELETRSAANEAHCTNPPLSSAPLCLTASPSRWNTRGIPWRARSETQNSKNGSFALVACRNNAAASSKHGAPASPEPDRSLS